MRNESDPDPVAQDGSERPAWGPSNPHAAGLYGRTRTAFAVAEPPAAVASTHGAGEPGTGATQPAAPRSRAAAVAEALKTVAFLRRTLAVATPFAFVFARATTFVPERKTTTAPAWAGESRAASTALRAFFVPAALPVSRSVGAAVTSACASTVAAAFGVPWPGL